MKMLYTNILYLIVLLIGSASSCDKDNGIGHGDDELTTTNNANHSVFSIITFNYPDTSLQQNGSCIGCFVEINANSSYQHFYFPNSKYGWKSHIVDRNLQNTLTMFIIHKDTLNKYSFEQIQEDYNILKRYDLSIDDLEKQDWTLTYP